jgi:hypothetical protein
MLKFDSRSWLDGRTLGGLPIINSSAAPLFENFFPFLYEMAVGELGWEATSNLGLDLARNRTRQRRDSWGPAARFLPTKSSLARSSGSAGLVVFCLLLAPPDRTIVFYVIHSI